MLKQRIKIANFIFLISVTFLVFNFVVLITSPTDHTDGSFRKEDFLISTIYQPDASPLKENDIVTHINGEELNIILRNRFIRGTNYRFQKGETLNYTVLREEEKRSINIKLGEMSLPDKIKMGYYYLIPLAIISIGYITFITSPQTKHSFSFLLMTIGLGITQAPGMFQAHTISFPPQMAIFYFLNGPLSAITLSAIPYFFFTFPNDLLKKFKKAFLLINLTIVSFATLIPLALPIKLMLRHYYLVQGYYWFALLIGVEFTIGLIWNFLKTKAPLPKQQLKYTAFGIALSIIPQVGFLVLPFLSRRYVLLPYELLTFIMLLFPISIALAIRKFKLFMIDKIINKTLLYAFTSAIIIGISIPLFIIFSYALQIDTKVSEIIGIIPVLTVTTIILVPLQNFLDRTLKRIFKRKELEFLQASETVLSQLNKVNQFSELYNYIRATLPSQLAIKDAELLIKRKDGFYYLNKFNLQDWKKVVDSNNQKKDYKLLSTLQMLSYKRDLKTLKNQLIKSYSVIVPLQDENKTIAIWLVGEKQSEDFYYHKDLEILNVIGQQLSLSIQNAKLIKEIKDKARKEKEVLERELELKKLKEEYITIVSHFLRTPITAAKGFIELLQREVKKKSDRKYVKNISLSIQKIHSITERIIVMSELEQGKLSLTLKEEKLGDIMKRTVMDLKGLAKEKEIDLKSEITINPTIKAEKNKLKQAISNIVENAIIYNKPSGTVMIRLTTEDNFAIISIEDTGKGISQKEIERIFTPFHRAHYEKEGFIIGEGIGIGIYLSKLIIDAHNGVIHYDSEQGKGTTVKIKLPIYEKEEQAK